MADKPNKPVVPAVAPVVEAAVPAAVAPKLPGSFPAVVNWKSDLSRVDSISVGKKADVLTVIMGDGAKIIPEDQLHALEFLYLSGSAAITSGRGIEYRRWVHQNADTMKALMGEWYVEVRLSDKASIPGLTFQVKALVDMVVSEWNGILSKSLDKFPLRGTRARKTEKTEVKTDFVLF